jgi:hypothetical protein
MQYSVVQITALQSNIYANVDVRHEVDNLAGAGLLAKNTFELRKPQPWSSS